jgi:hypothetical protein
MKTNTHALPFPRSYWVQPGRLLAGYYPGDQDDVLARKKIAALLHCGVRHIINLMEQKETDHDGRPFRCYSEVLFRESLQSGFPVTRCLTPVRDLGVPDLIVMRSILDSIDEALARGGCVYVHCWGGRGRTGTVIGCWLARHGLASGIGVLEQLATLTAGKREHFHRIPETDMQRAFVTSWEAGH